MFLKFQENYTVESMVKLRKIIYMKIIVELSERYQVNVYKFLNKKIINNNELQIYSQKCVIKVLLVESVYGNNIIYFKTKDIIHK